MLAQRLIVAIILIPLGFLIVAIGGWLLAGVLALALGFAAWEYWRIFTRGGYNPSALVLIAWTSGFLLARQALQFAYSDLMIALLLLITMGIQVFQYERGRETAAFDFNLTVGGALYLGWLAAYLLSIRNLPDGQWWLIAVLGSTILTDGSAYFVGRRLGRHKMSPLVSPKKTWEGYLGGILFAALGSLLLAALWNMRSPDITPLRGLILGLAISILTPLGDLGESMLKRTFGVKDSSNILPGHGGIMDRIDSWLWAAPISYYLILLFWQ